MTIYNAKQDKSGYRITKFTDDLDAEGSYITTRDSCQCPAGPRDTCRHRQMLPEFLAQKRVNTPWFLDWDNRQWFYYNSKDGRMMTHEPRPSWRRI